MRHPLRSLIATAVVALSAPLTAAVMTFAAPLANAQTAQAPAAAARPPAQGMVPALLAELARYQAAEKAVARHIRTFDTLDFVVFTGQHWGRLHESHAQDIVVHWPDGRTTRGIEPHIEDLKAMFVYAPDTRIQTHPVKFGQGEWTAVIGVLEGTFTQPMPIGNGQFIPPTGKAFNLTMATVGHWNGETMDEEFLFWDNATFMKQIGLAP